MTQELANAHGRSWALFGATGVTGRLILQRALKRGHRPTLIGRNRLSLHGLAKPQALPVIGADLADATALAQAVAGKRLVLNAAGPFKLTGTPLMSAALAAHVDYLDLNGELAALEDLFALDERAQASGVALIGGAGFGVAATDGLARRAVELLGGADWLRLSVAADSAFSSPAVAESVLEALAGGGREIEEGKLQKRAMGRRRWRETLPDGEQISFASAPLAELAAVARATQVARIVAGVPMPGTQAVILAQIAPMLPALLRIPAVRTALAGAGGHGGKSVVKTEHRSRVWVEAGRGQRRVIARLAAGEGFAAAADIAILAVEATLTRRPEPGAHTPATAFGSHFIADVPGVGVTFEQS